MSCILIYAPGKECNETNDAGTDREDFEDDGQEYGEGGDEAEDAELPTQGDRDESATGTTHSGGENSQSDQMRL